MKNSENFLKTPLISDSQNNMSQNSNYFRSNSISVKENGNLAGRIYASNAPKILLETISARTASLIIALTYILFIIGFSIDFYTVYQSFNSSNFDIGALPCSSQNLVISDQNHIWGCSTGQFWNSTVTHLNNVISTKLEVKQDNVTDILIEANSTFNIIYNVNLWACYKDGGCGSSFHATDTYTTDPGVWQKVLILNNEIVTIDKNTDSYNNDKGKGIQATLISNTFQNQESIPTNGLVKSYYISIEYLSNPYNIFLAQNDTSENIYYTFDVVSRPADITMDSFTIILLFLTICTLFSYLYVLKGQKKILSEQKWLVAYLILVLFFQNPIYCVIVWYKSEPPIGAAYGSYILGFIAQSGLFTLWLLFSDSVHRKFLNRWVFYLPKLFFGILIFTFAVVILTFQFPGLDPTGNSERSAVEAVSNWSHSLKINFIAFTLLYLILILLWSVIWFFRLYITGRRLTNLPYMSTRYLQLSYRFFSLQATLVTLYYVMQYALVIYFISNSTNSTDNNDLSTLTDNINTIFRQQSQLFGKILFLTAYALILTFLFLPSSFLAGSQGLMTSLACTYVISEKEHYLAVQERKKTYQKMKKNLINQVAIFNQLLQTKIDIFCVDMALKLRNLSFQAYYDPPELRSSSSYEGVLDLKPFGYEMINQHYDKEHEVFFYIAREIISGTIVVVFRGTASKKQMEENMKYSKKTIDFSQLDTIGLDQMDGLYISRYESNEFDRYSDLESLSDEEDYDEANDESHTDRRTFHDAMFMRAGQVGEGFRRAIHEAMDVTNQGINKVVDATTGLMVTAATNTPVLKNIVKIKVHSGFWDSYFASRLFIHSALRFELSKRPANVYFTGHSLGGALATYAALDFSLNSLPRIHEYLKFQEKKKFYSSFDSQRESSFMHDSSRPTFFQRAQNFVTQSYKSNFEREPSVSKPRFQAGIKIFMYNFGSPKVGNHNFAQLYNKIVPNSYRVVVDGDIVSGLPPSGYAHIGTEILIDSVGAGSIIIDPSFVERWLRTHFKSSVTVHSLLVYRKGLLGVKMAAEFMREHAKELDNENIDPLKLGLKVKVSDHVENFLDENAGIALEIKGDSLYASPNDSQKLSEDFKNNINPLSLELMASEDENKQQIQNKKSLINDTTSDENLNNQTSKIDAQHYAHDVESMNNLLKQIKTIKKSGPLEWLQKKAHSIGNFNRSGSHSKLENETDQEDEEKVYRRKLSVEDEENQRINEI